MELSTLAWAVIAVTVCVARMAAGARIRRHFSVATNRKPLRYLLFVLAFVPAAQGARYFFPLRLAHA